MSHPNFGFDTWNPTIPAMQRLQLTGARGLCLFEWAWINKKETPHLLAHVAKIALQHLQYKTLLTLRVILGLKPFHRL